MIKNFNKCNFYTWIQIQKLKLMRIRIHYQATQINADPDPQSWEYLLSTVALVSLNISFLAVIYKFSYSIENQRTHKMYSPKGKNKKI